jgi:hypothetical protein
MSLLWIAVAVGKTGGDFKNQINNRILAMGWHPLDDDTIEASNNNVVDWVKRAAQVAKDAALRPKKRKEAEPEREARNDRVNRRTGGSGREGRGG